MTGLLAIDPGNEFTAWCLLDAQGMPTAWAKEANATVLNSDWGKEVPIYIEMIACYGMAVGKEVFDTCRFIGRLEQAAAERGAVTTLIYRADVKMHLCHSMRADDSTIRAALIDRFGPGKDKAIGRKATPGPLYGMAGDEWAALAVAVTAFDTRPSYE